jgi:hypothetical protein
MDKITEIGILLTGKADKVHMGLVVLDPTGIRIYKILKEGMHPYSMKPIEWFFTHTFSEQALSKKYALQINEFGKIPDDTLWLEATHISGVMNMHGVSIGSIIVEAKSVKFRSNQSERRIVIFENN